MIIVIIDHSSIINDTLIHDYNNHMNIDTLNRSLKEHNDHDDHILPDSHALTTTPSSTQSNGSVDIVDTGESNDMLPERADLGADPVGGASIADTVNELTVLTC